eukprot:comp23539_c0_seq1/m.58918 comp23539_c0_seq1/g.58918  ORF comp23539_c0_seq1/g.58918 comp23539_c0_seq1/m.58918 type:complete len:323 (+) comp23539_c0_seq1:643-1611(+)
MSMLGFLMNRETPAQSSERTHSNSAIGSSTVLPELNAAGSAPAFALLPAAPPAAGAGLLDRSLSDCGLGLLCSCFLGFMYDCVGSGSVSSCTASASSKSSSYCWCSLSSFSFSSASASAAGLRAGVLPQGELKISSPSCCCPFSFCGDFPLDLVGVTLMGLDLRTAPSVAVASRSTIAHSLCLRAIATSSGVRPRIDSGAGSAPASSSRWTTSAEPLCAAACSGAWPVSSRQSMFGFLDSRYLTSGRLPLLHAKCSAVRSCRSLALICAPRSTSIFTIASRSSPPSRAARIRGVCSLRLPSSRSAPLSSSSLTNVASPRITA